MAKSKVKRYSNEGYVYEDDTPEEVANRSETSQNIANEAKGDTMLKSMRDQASKPKMVTKEELAKSGLSLRDYMNQQQGLSRRGGAASAPAPKNEGMSMTRMDPEKAQDAKRLGDQIVARDKAIVQQQNDRVVKDWKSKQATAKEAATLASLGGYKKGGSVSSASNRADGIAQRGKTRGKMC